MNEEKKTEKDDKEKRSVRAIGRRFYPIYPVDDAIKIAKAVKTCGGHIKSNEKDLIAKAVDVKWTGAFTKRLASAKIWGLLTGHGDIELSPIAKKILTPLSDDEYKEGIREAFLHVSVFKELYSLYKQEGLPNDELLRNMLERKYGVAEHDTLVVAKIFKNMVNRPEIADIIMESGEATEVSGEEKSGEVMELLEKGKKKTEAMLGIKPAIHSTKIVEAIKGIGKLETLAELKQAEEKKEDVEKTLEMISETTELTMASTAASEMLNKLRQGGINAEQAVSFSSMIYKMALGDLGIKDEQESEEGYVD